MKTNITLQSLDIHFFKGIKNLHVDFSDITTISGDNGLGKTTIADAFFWVLFNKDSLGRTKFRIRTIGVKNVDTYVDVCLKVNDREYTLRKQLITKQNDYGTEQNEEQSSTSKFFINGQSYTKKDYDATISDIISETTFRTITSPTYFFTLKWQEQRAMLYELCGDINDADINTDHQFDLIEDALHSQYNSDADAMRKHLAYQIKDIKQKLDIIPLQVTEQERVKPEYRDWSDIERQISDLRASIEHKYTEIADAKSVGSLSDAVLHQIEFQQKRIQDITISCNKMANLELEKYNAQMMDYKTKLSEYNQSAQDFKLKLQSLISRITQTNDTITQQKNEQAKIRTEWAERVNKPFILPEIDETCPTCGQPLPYNKVEEIKQRLREDYNLAKASAKKELTDRANTTKALILRAENDIKSYEAEVTFVRGQQSAVTTYIKNLDDKINALVRTAPRTAQQMMDDNDGYKDALKRLEELRNSSNPSDDNRKEELLAQLNNELYELQSAMGFMTDTLAEKNVYEKCVSRIEELKAQELTLRNQYDTLVLQQDLCTKYQLRLGELIEERVNKHFTFVRFGMFRRLINGDTEPYCEAYVDGVPYQTNVNSASRLNCGLDVCNAFSKKLSISAPVFCDNAESNNHIMATTGQQILIYVTRDETLQIADSIVLNAK